MDKPTFGERLRELRKKAGLTQEELAYKVGVHVMTIRRYESDMRIPTNINDIQRLAAILHVSEEELLNGAPEATWVLTVQLGLDQEEVINLSKLATKPISKIATGGNTAFLELGGSYELWTDDKLFNQMIKDFKKLRSVVIQNGIAQGGIKA